MIIEERVIPFTLTSDELISPNFQFFLNDAPNEVEKERTEETEDENDKGDEEETVNDETKKSLRKEIQEVKKDLESLKNTDVGRSASSQVREAQRRWPNKPSISGVRPGG
uniref:Uncharacterized protein n=1 Tax=Cucumis melo TaxID=3656 RepID=A0A9I9EAZ8_CUCME